MQQVVLERQLQLIQPTVVQVGFPLQFQRDFEPLQGLPPPPGRLLRNTPQFVMVVRLDYGRVEVLAVREPECFEVLLFMSCENKI